MTFDRESQLLPVVTLVVWLVCLIVGIGGWWLGYPRPGPTSKPRIEPVQAELIDVKISSQVSAAADSLPDAKPLQSPPPLDSIAAASLPAISFTVPTQISLQPVASTHTGRCRPHHATSHLRPGGRSPTRT